MLLQIQTPDEIYDILQIVDKIRVQMGAFLEDGSHETTIAVIHALVVAIPHTTEQLRDYILDLIHGKESVEKCVYCPEKCAYCPDVISHFSSHLHFVLAFSIS